MLGEMSDDGEQSQDDRRVVVLDVSWLMPADLGVVDALARLQLAALRCGWRLQLRGADGGLVELLEFLGLGDVVTRVDEPPTGC